MMLFAKFAIPPLAVAKARLAPGAMSWTIWSMARPSSVPEAQVGLSCRTVTGDRSLLATSAAAPPLQLKLSDSTPTLTPVPSTPNVARAMSARMARSPWLVTNPTFVTAYAGLANSSDARVSMVGMAGIGSRAETTRPAVTMSCAPKASRSAARALGSPEATASSVTQSPAAGRKGWLHCCAVPLSAAAKCSAWSVFKSSVTFVAGFP